MSPASYRAAPPRVGLPSLRTASPAGKSPALRQVAGRRAAGTARRGARPGGTRPQARDGTTPGAQMGRIPGVVATLIRFLAGKWITHAHGSGRPTRPARARVLIPRPLRVRSRPTAWTILRRID